MSERNILWIVETSSADGRWWPIFKDHVYATRNQAREATKELRKDSADKFRYRQWMIKDCHP